MKKKSLIMGPFEKLMNGTRNETEKETEKETKDGMKPRTKPGTKTETKLESKKRVLGFNKGYQHVRFGILQKLIFGFIIPVAFIIILGVISYKKASVGLITNYEKATDNTISMATSYLKYVVESVDALSIQYTEADDISYFARGLVFTDRQERLSFVTSMNNELLQKTELEKFIENIHIIGKEDIPVLTSDMENVEGFYDELIDSEEGQLLKEGEKDSAWIGSHPFIDDKIGLNPEAYSLSVIRKYPSDDACIVVDISTSEILTFLKELELGENSIVGLIAEDGNEILIKNSSSKEEDKLETNFSFLNKDYFVASTKSEKATKSKYIKYQSQEYLFMYSKIGDTGMTICGLIPKKSFMQQASAIRNTTIIIVAIASILAVSIGLFISNGIGKSMKKINRKLQQISEGDLTVHVSVNRKDEFAILAGNIMNMLNNMRELIQKMAHVSDLVSVSAANILGASKTIAISNGNITKAVDEIGIGIEGQATDSQNCLTQMDELSKKISIAFTNLNEIEVLTDEMKGMVSNGIKTMVALTKQSEDTNNITKYVVSNIKALEENILSIANFIGVINDIADQTNLLSLNASIEAARAGEVGKGFAVVANEIRKLANKSMTAAKEIQAVIDKIMNQTFDTVQTAKEAESVVGRQNEAVNHTIEAFYNMNHGIERLITNLSVITNNMSIMEESREGTLTAVENISAISEETLATSGTIENTVCEQSKSVLTLEQAANEMNENAKDLKEAMNTFRI